MATFLEICEAFATLPPFKTSASGEVYGSSLPLWHGVNDDALSKLITHSTKEDKDWPVGNFARAVKKQFPHLGDALRRELGVSEFLCARLGQSHPPLGERL